MDVLKIRFCTNRLLFVYGCVAQVQLWWTQSSFITKQYYCPLMAINQLWGNSLNALLIQRLLRLPNNSKPTYLPDHPKRAEDASGGEKDNSSNWNGWRHPEKFKNPPTSETVTMVRSCQNTTIYYKSNKESLYVDPHGMMEKMASPASAAYVPTTTTTTTSWLVFTKRIPKYWLVKKREKLVRYFVH